MTENGQIVVRHEPDANRYVVEVDGRHAGLLSYRESDGVVTLPHTEVDDAYEGRGVGSRLVSDALDDIRRRSLRVVPSCPFVRAYIDRHPEHADLLAD